MLPLMEDYIPEVLYLLIAPIGNIFSPEHFRNSTLLDEHSLK